MTDAAGTLTVTEPTAIQSAEVLETARSAMEQLWNMLQDEDGNPLSIPANDLLLTIYGSYEQIAGRYTEVAAQADGLMNALRDVREQRDAALRKMDLVRDNGAKGAINVLLSNLHYDFGIEKDAARAVLDIIMGKDTGLPYYTIGTLRRAFELIEDEIREEREQDELDAELGDPEDDYDPE